MNFQRNSFHLLFCGHYDNNYIVFIGFIAATVLLMWHIFIFKNRSLGGFFFAPQVSRKGRMLRRVIGTANCERKGKQAHPVQCRMVMRTGNSFGQQCYSLSHHLLPLYPIIYFTLINSSRKRIPKAQVKAVFSCKVTSWVISTIPYFSLFCQLLFSLFLVFFA